MRRREFLIKAGIAAGLAPECARASVECPSSSAESQANNASDDECADTEAQKDWIARSSGPDVVWAHDFGSAAEVSQFRWASGYGNDPGAVRPGSDWVSWGAMDGIPGTRGKCLQILRPAGTNDPGQWIRPFSAIRAGDNGRSVDDAGASGRIAALPFNAQIANTTDRWVNGGYANADYHTDGVATDGCNYDGTEYYLQLRAKISRSRWRHGNEAYDGKFCVFQVTGQVSAFDLVQQNTASGVYQIYTAFGSPGPLEFLYIPQATDPGPGTSYQPGGAFDKTCAYSSWAPGPNYLAGRKRSCWLYPVDSWFTVLIHVVPGHLTTDAWGAPDWGVQIWVAPYGAKTYTAVYDVANYRFYHYPAGILKGWNAVFLNSYFNHQNMPSAFNQSFTQIILSQKFIPCPQY